MKAKLKDGEFRVGNNFPFWPQHKGQVVTITETEGHFLYGKRYKVAGYDEWFEANCFEYIEGE